MHRATGAHSAYRFVAVAAALVVAVFIALVSYAFYGRTGSIAEHTPQQARLALAEGVVGKNLDVDTDGDGLAAWEELLWGTDPDKADTDMDGVGDGEEVAQNKSPVIAGMGTDADATTALAFAAATTSDLNATQVLAREFFGTYLLSLQEKGVHTTPEEQARIVKQALTAGRAQLRNDLPDYTTDDVHTVPVTPESFRVYVRAVEGEIERMTTKAPANEFGLLEELAQGDDKNTPQADLRTLAAFYNAGVNTLAALPVPEDALAAHVELVDTLRKYAYGLESIGSIGNDPFRGATALQLFMQQMGRLPKSFELMRTYINTHRYATAAP